MTPSQQFPDLRLRNPRAAVWMVKQSLPVSKREAGLKLFDEKFADEYEKSDCDVEARNWALRHGWEALHTNYKPMIDITMYTLTIIGVTIGLIALA